MFDVLKACSNSIFRQALRDRLFPAVALMAPWMMLRSALGLAIVAVCLLLEALWLWWQTKTQVVSWLDSYCPELEDSASLLAPIDKPSVLASLQRARLESRLKDGLTPLKLRQITQAALPWRRTSVVLSWLLAAAVYAWPASTTLATKRVAPMPATTTSSSTLLMSVKPPLYTQIARFQTAPKAIQVPEHSEVSWCVQRDPATVLQTAQQIRLSNGQELSMVVNEQSVCAHWQASETVFWTWSADPKQERLTITVQLDQAPEITIKEPTELLQVLANHAQHIFMQVQVKDDYQVSSASLHMTLARGSGENIRFSDKEVPLPQGVDQRTRDWSRRWTLAELGMEPGDELYFFVRVVDNAAKNPHVVRSPTYTLRLPAPDAVAEDVSVLPVLAKPESLRSQRQIIIDTEQLVADIAANPTLSAALIRSRSESIANDQAALRRRYGRFLGEESSLFGDEHEDADHANEKSNGDLAAQYGHAHDQEENATLFDEATKKVLRRALVAMWDAEKSLRAITPKLALPAENKALEAIKQLQQADRIYLHKAAFTPPAIKEEKRLSGDVLDVRSQQRSQNLLDDTVPTEVKELVLALGSGGALPALWVQHARGLIAQQIKNDAQRLQAQAAVQDVIDGCQPCRAVLAAWLRQCLPTATERLQGWPVMKTKAASRFEQGWNRLKQPVGDAK